MPYRDIGAVLWPDRHNTAAVISAENAAMFAVEWAVTGLPDEAADAVADIAVDDTATDACARTANSPAGYPLLGQADAPETKPMSPFTRLQREPCLQSTRVARQMSGD